jgi:hypothetical protein
MPRPPPRQTRFAWLIALTVLPGCTEGPVPLPPLPPRVLPEVPAPGPARPAHRLAIALVGEVRGEVEPCGCPTQPLGGFEHRAGLLDELRAEPAPLFHLDAGHMLVEGFATGGRGDPTARAELMLDLSAATDLDAFCPAPGDLGALGVEALAEELGQRGIAAVSATWLDESGTPVFPASTVLERGGVRLGVIGLSDAPRANPGEGRIHAADPVVAARTALAALPAEVDLTVALSNLRDDDARRVAREVPGLAALLSIRGQAYEEPQQYGAGLIIKAPNRGRYVTVVRVRAASDPGAALDLPTAEALDLRTYDLLVRRRDDLAHRAPPAPLLEPDAQSLVRLGAALDDEGAGRNLAYVVAYPLGPSYLGDEPTRARISAFKDRTLQDAAARLATEQASPGGPRRFASTSRCAGCHTEQYARWALTEHTRAWEALIQRGRDADPECVTCHATGFALPGGWAELDPDLIRQFKAVQCEACHGPLEGHPEDPEARALRPDRGTCLGCHDEANSPGFDFATYLPRASCTVPAPAAPGFAGGAPPPPVPETRP